VPDVVEALIATYKRERQAAEHFIDTVRRIGLAPFKQAADAERRATATA
jgi:sulfite reductase (NADPH) hemoprotein beta-component